MEIYNNQELEDGLYIVKLSIALGGSDRQLRSFRNGKWEGVPPEVEVLELEKANFEPAWNEDSNVRFVRKGGPEHEEFERKYKRE